MHPWEKIVKGSTEVFETETCFMCLKRIPCSDGEMEDIKKHWKNAHFVKYNLNQLVQMSAEAEEREKRRREESRALRLNEVAAMTSLSSSLTSCCHLECSICS